MKYRFTDGFSDLEIEPGACHMSDEPNPHYLVKQSVDVSIKWRGLIFVTRLTIYEGEPCWPVYDCVDDLGPSQIAMDIDTEQADFINRCEGSPESPGRCYNPLSQQWIDLPHVEGELVAYVGIRPDSFGRELKND